MAEQSPKQNSISTVALWLIAVTFAIATAVTYVYVYRPISIRKECDRLANENISLGIDYQEGYNQCVHARGLAN
jgi:hypothetical protein